MENNFIMVKIPAEKYKRRRKIIAFITIPIILILIINIGTILYYQNIKDKFLVKEYIFSDAKIEFKIGGSNKTLEVQTKITDNDSVRTHFKYIDFDFSIENKLIKRTDLMTRFANFILRSNFWNINEREVYAYLINKELSKKPDTTVRFEGEEENSQNAETEIFATLNGECYHLEKCRFLGKSKIPIELSEAVEKYRACSFCAPPQ